MLQISEPLPIKNLQTSFLKTVNYKKERKSRKKSSYTRNKKVPGVPVSKAQALKGRGVTTLSALSEV